MSEEWATEFVCITCDSPLRCEPGKIIDVRWFCTNTACEHHAGEDTGDQDEPNWAKSRPIGRSKEKAEH